MLPDDYTGYQTALAIGSVFVLLWLLSVISWVTGVIGFFARMKAERVRFALRAGLSLALFSSLVLLLIPFMGLYGAFVFEETFMDREIRWEEGARPVFWSLTMPVVLAIIIVSAFILLPLNRKRIKVR